MDSASSASDMIGSEIFLTMTALPDSEAATSLVLMAAAVEQTTDGVGDGGAVDDRAIDDAVGRQRFGAETGDLEGLADRLQFHRFDGARSDVEADQCLGSTEHSSPQSPSIALIGTTQWQVKCHG